MKTNRANARTLGQTIWHRLRPFVRRDLKGRLISASIAALVIAGLSWFGLSAFTHLDSAGARDARIELGLEHGREVCSNHAGTWRLVESSGMPKCTFDDRTQQQADKDWARDIRLRSAILHELDLRLAATLENLEEAQQILERQEVDLSSGRVAGDAHLAELIELPAIAPLRWKTIYTHGYAFDDLKLAATYDPVRDLSPAATREIFVGALEQARAQVLEHQATVNRQRSREPEPDVSSKLVGRTSQIAEVRQYPDRHALELDSLIWFEQGLDENVSHSAWQLANEHPEKFAAALDPEADIWSGGWEAAVWTKRHQPTARYYSPVDDATRYRLAGVLFFAIAAFVFVVVGPIVTATATAREREAGTLPVLRMTGMSADQLAMAMVVGPNVFALILGGSLLLGSIVLLSLTVGAMKLLLPLGLLAVLAAATHLTAIGLGDALGQRVNAMVVGALLGVGIVFPGLLGAGLASFDVAATGLLLGPLPALMASIGEISGLNHIGLFLGDDLTRTMLTYSISAQGVLAVVCLGSWRRRVEQGWAPLFRPFDGVILALLSIGCSALTLLDINHHHQAENFDSLNLLTFLSSVFLLPVLAWLLAASLRRPARAGAVADHVEARRAFLRFQGFVAVTAALVGLTYHFVMNEAGLSMEKSEVMWATLCQLLLAAETAVATLLWASRRREGKLRIAFLGGALVLMQLGSVFGTYGIEVSHVALTNGPALPLLLDADVSPYWLGFMILCWAAGLALIFTALLRRRDDKQQAARERAQAEAEEDDDFGMPGRRLIH